MRLNTPQGTKYVSKLTTFMTNSPEIARILQRKCAGDHSHVTLLNGLAKKAEVYPPALGKAICRGLKHQLLRDQNCEEPNLCGLTGQGPGPQYYDNITGAPLDAAMVRLARAEEMEFFRKMQVYEKVPLRECLSTTGKTP